MISINGGKRRFEEQTMKNDFELKKGAVLELHNTMCDGSVISDGTGTVTLTTSNGKSAGIGGIIISGGGGVTFTDITSMPGTLKPPIYHS